MTAIRKIKAIAALALAYSLAACSDQFSIESSETETPQQEMASDSIEAQPEKQTEIGSAGPCIENVTFVDPMEWHACEAGGRRWMKSTTATIEVALPEEGASAIVLSGRIYGDPRTLSAYIADEEVMTGTFSPDQTVRIPLSNNFSEDTVSIRLVFDGGPPQSPKERGESIDSRPLVMMLRSVSFD